MNERLKELRKQAWKEAYNVDPDDPRIARAHKAMEEGMAKFAELIVRECAGVMQKNVNLNYDHCLDTQILEHFGVEE
jgi:hypothetical protein